METRAVTRLREEGESDSGPNKKEKTNSERDQNCDQTAPGHTVDTFSSYQIDGLEAGQNRLSDRRAGLVQLSLVLLQKKALRSNGTV
jgi:hypothetical protein